MRLFMTTIVASAACLLACGKPQARPADHTSTEALVVPEPTPTVVRHEKPLPAPPCEEWLSTETDDGELIACQPEGTHVALWLNHAFLGEVTVSSHAGACPEQTAVDLASVPGGGGCLDFTFEDRGCEEATGSLEHRRICLPPPAKVGVSQPLDFLLSYSDAEWNEVSPAECEKRKLNATEQELDDPQLCFDRTDHNGSGYPWNTTSGEGEDILCFTSPDGAQQAFRVVPGVFEPVEFRDVCGED